jgi:hypothetical protein
MVVANAHHAPVVRRARAVVVGDGRAHGHVHERGEDTDIVADEVGRSARAWIDRRLGAGQRSLPGAVGVHADAGVQGPVTARQGVARHLRCPRRRRRRHRSGCSRRSHPDGGGRGQMDDLDDLDDRDGDGHRGRRGKGRGDGRLDVVGVGEGESPRVRRADGVVTGRSLAGVDGRGGDGTRDTGAGGEQKETSEDHGSTPCCRPPLATLW